MTTGRSRSSLLVGPLLLAGLGGCQRSPAPAVARLVDNIWEKLDFGDEHGPSDLLHVPYVVGAAPSIYVKTTNDTTDPGWSMTSSDPAIFRLGDLVIGDRLLYAPGAALAPGHSLLIARDEDGNVIARGPVDVELPDRVDLLDHAALLAGATDSAATSDEAEILAGGTATYLAHYLAHGELLHGTGVLGVTGPADIGATPSLSDLDEQRDWLQITPASMPASAPSSGPSGGATEALTLTVDGRPIALFPVVPVRVDAIDHLAITIDSGNRVAVARAFDRAGHPIGGVPFTWSADGMTAAGTGDLYDYKYGGSSLAIVASYGGLTAEATLPAAYAGTVDSSNDLSARACFLATAAFGSADAPAVATLRHFRDRVLLPSFSGRVLVRAYYALSPPLALLERTFPLFRSAVRSMLWPIARMAAHAALAAP